MKKTHLFIGFISLFVLFISCGGGYNKKFSSATTLVDSFSFAAGAFFAEQHILPALKQGGDDSIINFQLFMSGIESVFAKDTTLNREKMFKIIDAYFGAKSKQQRVKDSLAAAENKTKGSAFLAENKDKEGVKVTETGLQYKIIKEGTGIIPTAEDRVEVHYEGKLLNDSIFDSSYKRGTPAQFALNGVIAGWTEGFQLFKEGTEAVLYIPSELAYGDNPQRNIPAGSTLIFKVELLKVLKEEQQKKK